MKVLIDITHPAHVHLFKHFAKIMIAKGHDILMTAREKEVAVELLKEYDFSYRSFGRNYRSLIGKLGGMLKFDYLLFREARKFRPDLFLSMASIYAAHAAFAMRKPHIAFEDSEPVPEHQVLYVPFTDTILTPEGLKKSFGSKQIRYPGFNEIAYLHPKYFNPDPAILDMLGVKLDERYSILRFVAFEASHDIGIKGFSNEDKYRLTTELSKYGKVFITSERELPENLSKYRVNIPPSKIQDALYYASLYVGDSQTMATESALLGTPTIRCNKFAKTKKEMSNFIELEEQFNLIKNYNIQEKNEAIENAIDFIKDETIKNKWSDRKNDIFARKIDVTEFMVWFVENYPGSINEVKNDQGFFNKYISYG